MDLFTDSIFLKKIFMKPLSHVRYGVLLAQRPVHLSDKEQIVTLLEFIGAEDGQYQFGLTKVQYID